MLRSETVVVPPQHDYPFYVTAKRYPHPAFRENPTPQRSAPLILLFLHSTSFHKEIYEPVLEGLWACTANGALNIREAWAVECPNHGESAVLNYDVLRQPKYANYFSCERYADAVHRFMRAGGKDGLYINTNANRIAAIGHSLGGVAAVILSAKVQFSPLIIIDPFFFPGETEELVKIRQSLVNNAHERKDTWSSRQEAAKAFASKKNCRSWDPGVLKLYIQYGLREHPTSNNAVSPYKGVTLACTRDQEATMYRDTQSAQVSIPYLDAACRTTNVHIAFGGNADIIPRYVQENLVDIRIRRFASITWIPGAGHLVLQQAPQAVMEMIHKVLCPPPRGRL